MPARIQMYVGTDKTVPTVFQPNIFVWWLGACRLPRPPQIYLGGAPPPFALAHILSRHLAFPGFLLFHRLAAHAAHPGSERRGGATSCARAERLGGTGTRSVFRGGSVGEAYCTCGLCTGALGYRFGTMLFLCKKSAIVEDPGAHAARVSHTGSRAVGTCRKIWETRNMSEHMGNFEKSGQIGN